MPATQREQVEETLFLVLLPLTGAVLVDERTMKMASMADAAAVRGQVLPVQERKVKVMEAGCKQRHRERVAAAVRLKQEEMETQLWVAVAVMVSQTQ